MQKFNCMELAQLIVLGKICICLLKTTLAYKIICGLYVVNFPYYMDEHVVLHVEVSMDHTQVMHD